MNILLIIGNLINIVIQAILVKYVHELEDTNCECSMNWQQQIIKYFSPVMIIVSIFMIFLLLTIGLKKAISYRIFRLIISGYSILTFLYMINIIVHFIRLRLDKNCDCSKNWKRWFLLYPLLYIIIGFIIGLIMFTLISSRVLSLPQNTKMN